MILVSAGPAPPWRGGISHYHYALTGALRTLGDDVRVCNFRVLYPRFLFPGTTPLEEGAGSLPPEGERLLHPLRPGSWRRAARWASRAAPDALLMQWWHPFFAPAYLGLLRGLPDGVRVGMVCHNVDAHEKMPLGGWLTRRLFGRTDFFVTGGALMADRIRAMNPAADVEVVLHPSYELPHTRTAPPREEARRLLLLDEDAGPCFLFFGLVRPYKGLDLLLDALADLPRDRPWTCIVAGEFYERREPYEEQIERAGLSDRVRVEDRYIPNAEVPVYFAACDVVVLPYREATQSGVAALATALCRPVLTTTVGALPEMVQEGKNGWLVPPGDVPALAAQLLRFVEHPAAARIPVCEGQGVLPGWEDLAACVHRMAAGS